jgi:hypothetical protein
MEETEDAMPSVGLFLINTIYHTSDVVQIFSVTGCIRPETLDRLNPDDGGGQYDSSGGDGGQGNPQGSVCIG